MQPGQHPRRREVEFNQAEQENPGGAEQHGGHGQARGQRPVENIGISRTQVFRVRCRQLGHARVSLPNNRPRAHPVPISMTNTATMIISRIALTSE
jgi:hypothetical protein